MLMSLTQCIVMDALQVDLQGYCLPAVLLPADECRSGLVLVSATFCVDMPGWTSLLCLLSEDGSPV